MPTYTFKNNDTNEEFESFMSIKEYDQYLIDNPHISRTWYSAPAISGDSVGLGFRKPDNGFNDLMHRIGKANRGSAIADKYVSRNTTEVKVAQAVEKNRKR